MSAKNKNDKNSNLQCSSKYLMTTKYKNNTYC